MPPGRDSFRRNRVAPVQPYFSILACRIPAFASGFRRVHRCTATVSAWYTTATALSCFSSPFHFNSYQGPASLALSLLLRGILRERKHAATLRTLDSG